MIFEEEYWDCDCNLSKKQLYELLYAVTILKGAITCTFTLGCERYSKKQNSRNTGFYKVRLPKGKREEFEEMSGLKLTEPPIISGN